MEYTYFIADLIKRTKSNLKEIKSSRKTETKYDVTQAINSLLGTVIIPKEAYQTEAKELRIQRACQDDILGIDAIVQKCIQEKRIFCTYGERLNAIEFLRHIRNSVAHGGDQGLTFYPVGAATKNIESIIFYDENINNDSEKFCVELTVNQVFDLIKYSGNIYQYIDISKGEQDWTLQINEKRALFNNGLNKSYQDFNERNIQG